MNSKQWQRSHKSIHTQARISETSERFEVQILGSPITRKSYNSLEEARSGADAEIAKRHPSHSCEKSQCGEWRGANSRFTPESFKSMCVEVSDRWLNVSLFAQHGGDNSFKRQMILELSNDVWNYIGCPDKDSFRVTPVSLSDQDQYNAYKQEVINMVLSYSAHTFPPGVLIEEAFQRALDSWHRRGSPYQA